MTQENHAFSDLSNYTTILIGYDFHSNGLCDEFNSAETVKNFLIHCGHFSTN